jgi:predicted permease
MAAFLNAVAAVAMIFALMAVGIFLGRLGWIGEGEKKFLSRFVINIAVPMNCLTGILGHLSHKDLGRMVRLFPVPLFTILICLALSAAAAKLLKLPKRQKGVFIALAFISNTLFIGLPMSQELFGAVSVPWVMVYYMVSTVFTQSVALMLVVHSGEAEGTQMRAGGLIKSIFTKPPIIGVIAAYIILILGIHLPAFAMDFAGYLGDTVTPLALIYCGYVVYAMGIKNVRFVKGMPTLLILRLILAPAICAGLCLIFRVTGLARPVFIVEAALPSVSQITIMAGNYGADENYAACGTILTMIGMFITIPFLMVILSR